MPPILLAGPGFPSSSHDTAGSKGVLFWTRRLWEECRLLGAPRRVIAWLANRGRGRGREADALGYGVWRVPCAGNALSGSLPEGG